uniref:Kinesin motor domain-containing protein n=1 Tax=Hucho hucho TaxID=62062 RepID=A0A4W5JPE1_9TELE
MSAKVIIHMEGSTTSIDCNKKHLSKGTPGTGLKDRGRHSFSYDFSYDSTDVGSPNFVPQEKGDIGLIPRICEGLFCQISEKSQGDGASFRTEVSYLEIYNERVQDLLTSKKSPENGSGLKVREHPKDGPFVEDLSKHLVQNYRDIEKLLHAGNGKRTTSGTGMNDVSSRSHAIFTINFTQARFDAELPCETVSKIHLVDLAGSERADATCATGARLKEGANINKSLVTLGIVISALGDGGGSHKGKRKKQLFIPYRDSVLTWLLKDSLGGNSKTIMIATLSPAEGNYSETLRTLHYANRAKNIVNKPTVNEDSSVTVIRKLQEEIVRLKGLVEKNNQARLSPQDLSKTLKVEEKLHKNEAKVLELTREWTNKWGETQNILKEETVALRKQGIGVVLDSKLPHLIGINDDLLSTGIILYHLKEGRTLLGRDEASSNQDIVLHGAGLLEEHCVFENRDGVVTLIPQTGALCSVNRLETTRPCQLTQGAVIQLGRGTIFRFNHPKEAAHLREQRKSGLLSSLSLTDFSRLFHPGMDMFAVAGENGDSRQQRSSVLSPQLQTCTVMTEAMPMEAPVSVSRHPSACYAVPLQIGAGAPQHLQAVSFLHVGVNRWRFGEAEGCERPCSSDNEESQSRLQEKRARASPVHRTGTPTLTSDPTLTPTALERDSLQQGLEGEVEEKELEECHQSGSGVGVSERRLEGALPLSRAREEGGLYWGEEAWSGPGDRDEESNQALQQTPVLLVQKADVCTVGPEGLPGPANKSPGVLSDLPDGCRVLGGVLATDCCRGDLSRAGARYGGPAGTSLGTAISYLQRGDGRGIDGWMEERMDRAHLPLASSSSTYTQTSPSRFDTHTPSVSQLDNHIQAKHTASLSQIDTHNDSQATHTATRQDRHRRSQAVRGLPLEALEGQFSRVMMDRSRMTVEGHRENDKEGEAGARREGEAGARREEVEQNFRLGALVSRVFREEEEWKEEEEKPEEELEEENQFSVSGLSVLVRRVCQISGIGGEQELDSLGEEVSGMGSLVSRGVSWMFPDTGRLLRSSTPRILHQVWDDTVVLQPAAGGGSGSLQPGAGGGASSNWSSQVVSIVRESQVLSVVKDSQVFSLVRESQVYSLVRDSQVFSMVSELPLVHHISTELTQDFGIIHNELTQVLQPVESTGLQQRAIDLNTTLKIELPLVHTTVLSTVPRLYPAHNTIELANKWNTGKEVDWRAKEQSPIRELACTSEQEGREEALAKLEEQSPIRKLVSTSEQEGRAEALAKLEEQSPIRELECTSEQEGGEEDKLEEQSPIRELECTSEQEGREEALAKSEEPSPIRELACTSELEGREEALAKLEEQCPIRELACTSELDGRVETLAKSEVQYPIRELVCTSELEGREEALAKSEEQCPIRELACTSELEGREEALAKSEEQCPIRELVCTSGQEGREEALAKSEEPSPIRELECTSEQERREEVLAKSEEQCPIRELACTSEQEGREEALAKSEEPSPIRELACTSELEGREEALAKSEEQCPIRELACTSELEGREEALAKSEEQCPIRELACTSGQEGREEALAKSEEPSPIREMACTLEQEGREENKLEEQSPIRELECTSEQEGREEALAKSEEPSPIRELECTSEQEGGEKSLAMSEEQSVTKETLWPSKDQIEIAADQQCVTCGAKSSKSQPPPEQRNTSSTGPEKIFIPGHGNQRTDDVQVYYGSLVEFPGALVKLQSLPVSTVLGCLQSILPSVFTSRRLLALYWLGVANCSQPRPHLALVLLLESCLYALTFDPDTPDQTRSLTVFHHLPLLQVKEILVGFGGQSLRLKASSEESVLTLYTHSQTLTQALTHTLLGVLCPGDQRVSQHPLLVENLMVLSLDWKAQAPDLLLNAELRLSGQFHKTLADLVYLVHGNMNREKPHLGDVRLLLYTSVGVTTTPDPRPDPWAQLLLTDTHLGLVQEDTVFHPAPHHVPLLSRQAQFKRVTLRCLSDVRCVIVRGGVGSSTGVGGDGASDEDGATRLDIILSQDWRTRGERPRGHPERGAVAEADGSEVGGVAGAGVLSAASNSCPPQQQAEVWKLHFSCSSEAACLINHLSNV